MSDTTRRKMISAVTFGALATVFGTMPMHASAQAKEVRIALIAPFSGPWARQGDLMIKGA